MAYQYVLSAGQLQMDKAAFACEMLLPGSPLKKLLGNSLTRVEGGPKLIKSDDIITVDYNGSAGIDLDEHFHDLFKLLKKKYQGKLKGRIIIRISALSYYEVTLNLNSEDDTVQNE